MTKKQAPAETGATEGAFPFEVNTTQTARSLIRIHQLLRGEQLKHRDSEDAFIAPAACIQHLAEIEAVLKFLSVDFDPSKLKPRRARPRIGPLGYGQVRAGVLAALKRAGDWQTYSQLADEVLRQHGLTLNQAQRKHFLQKLREATHALKVSRAVIAERPLTLGYTGIEQRWKLSTMFD